MATGDGTATIDFGSSPVAEASFTIAAAGIVAGAHIEVWVQDSSTVSNDNQSHKQFAWVARFDPGPANSGAGTFPLSVWMMMGLVTGTFVVHYAWKG